MMRGDPEDAGHYSCSCQKLQSDGEGPRSRQDSHDEMEVPR